METTRFPKKQLPIVLGIVVGSILGLTSAAGPAGATYPGLNGKVYFEQDYSIWSLAPDGTRKKVVPSTKFSGLSEAMASPDGRRIAFSSYNGGSDIFSKNLAQGTYKNITGRASDKHTLTSLFFPSWSPDGKKLVFQATRNQRRELWRINADGTSATRLIRFSAYSTEPLNPEWGPTNKIVFEEEESLYTMAPQAGADPVKVTDPTEFDDRGLHFPSWSPDGTMIVAEADGTSFADGGAVIVRPNPGVGEAKYVYLTGDEDNQRSEVIEDPTWSPDGQWIVYYGNWAPGSAQMADYDLWKVSVADPTTPIDLNARTDFGNDVYRPNWAVKP